MDGFKGVERILFHEYKLIYSKLSGFYEGNTVGAMHLCASCIQHCNYHNFTASAAIQVHGTDSLVETDFRIA